MKGKNTYTHTYYPEYPTICQETELDKILGGIGGQDDGIQTIRIVIVDGIGTLPAYGLSGLQAMERGLLIDGGV